ncbi:MAG: TatD family hydrolase [Pseudomonadota bacterium]
MQFFDSHCHLHDSRIISDLPQILERAANAGVSTMVTCATMEENFELTSQLSQQYSTIIPCFGIHPWFLDQLSSQWKTNLESRLLSVPSGVGETGLDFTDKRADRDLQVRVFEHQLMLSMELERPINIHIRKAWGCLIDILKHRGKLKTPGLIHSYSGSPDMIPVLEKYGLYISFSGSITHPGSKKGINGLKTVSKDRFVLETDSPDIYPYLSDKKTIALNEPVNLFAIAKIAAQRLDTDIEAFSNQAYENSLVLFDTILPKDRYTGKDRKDNKINNGSI